MSGRAQRKIAEEQAARRNRLMIIGSAIGAALLIALIVFLVTRPRDVGPPVLAAELTRFRWQVWPWERRMLR
jgi:hypothetical protein